MPLQALRDTTIKRVRVHIPGGAWDGGDLYETEHATIVAGEVINEGDVDDKTFRMIRDALENDPPSDSFARRQHDHFRKIYRVISEKEAEDLKEKGAVGLEDHVPEHDTEAQFMAESGLRPLTRQETLHVRSSVDPGEADTGRRVLEGEEARRLAQGSPGDARHHEHEYERLKGESAIPADVEVVGSEEAKLEQSDAAKRLTQKAKERQSSSKGNKEEKEAKEGEEK